MTNYWAYIAALGSLLTLLAVLPFLMGMAGIALNLNMETASPEMIEHSIRLLLGAVMAIVPLSAGGVALFVVFQFAEEMA